MGEFSVKKLKLGFDDLGVQSGKVEEGVGNSDQVKLEKLPAVLEKILYLKKML